MCYIVEQNDISIKPINFMTKPEIMDDRRKLGYDVFTKFLYSKPVGDKRLISKDASKCLSSEISLATIPK